MHIVLVICPYQQIEFPLLGPAYLCEYLLAKGYSAEILDLNLAVQRRLERCAKLYPLLSDSGRGFWEDPELFLLAEMKELVALCVGDLEARSPSLVGFSLHRYNSAFAFEVARLFRAQNPQVGIIGGGPVTLLRYPDDCLSLRRENPPIFHDFKAQKTYFEGVGQAATYRYLRPKNTLPGDLFDAVVFGEGELALLELVRSYEQKGCLTGTSQGGIAYRGCRETLRLEPPPVVDNLDELPFPRFLQPNRTRYTGSSLPLLLSRGCVRKCLFCAERLGPSYRTRSAEHLFAEVEHHLEVHGCREFTFHDSNLSANPRVLGEFCSLVLRGGQQLSFSGQFAVHAGLQQEQLNLLVRAGGNNFVIGVESLADPVLAAMHKGYGLAEIAAFLERCKKAGLGVSLNLITGYPTETEAEHRTTLENLSRFAPYYTSVINAGTCKIIWDTELFAQHAELGIDLPLLDASALWRRGENTWEVRQRRLNELAATLKNLGKPVVSLHS